LKDIRFINIMKKKILRIIDANINRATEGLRVVEEILRFVYKDEKIYKNLRIIRHNIVKLFQNLYPDTVFQRDSNIDPGKNAKEKKYKNINEIIISNFHRTTESFRVLEEIAKLILPDIVSEVKKLRYEVYDLEKYVIKKFLK